MSYILVICQKYFKVLCIGIFVIICWYLYNYKLYKICEIEDTDNQPTNLFDDFFDSEWPADHPLPLPKWGISNPYFVINSIEVYEEIIKNFEYELQMLLKTINYDSVTNFIELYDQYKNNNHLSFEDFFRKYIPTLNKNANNCVGLALLLIEKLKQFDDRYSGIKNCFYLVSCEINLQSFDKYENTEYPCPWLSVNEHIMVALKIEIDGRVGVLLLDPGYPLDRVITVMNDQEYPNTGHFLSSTNPEEVYLIEMIMQGKYLQWSIYDESNLKETNLIYIGAPYLSPISVTERRNLVFTYRFFFSLSEKGENLSGIFAKIDEHILCLYYIDEDYPKEKQIIKLTPELFSSVNQLDSDIKKTLDRISHHLKISSKELWNILTKLNHIIEDEQFLDSLCKINNDIQNLNSGK